MEPHKECKYKREIICFLRILLINIAILGLIVIALAFFGHRSFNNALKISIQSTTSVTLPYNTIQITDEASLVGHLMGFYDSVITILSIIIAIISLVGFLYLRHISKSEVNEAVSEVAKEIDEKVKNIDETISSKIREMTGNDFFKSYLRENLNTIFKKETKEGGVLADFINEQVEALDLREKQIIDLNKRIDELQDTVVALQQAIEGIGHGNAKLKQPEPKKALQTKK